MQLPSVKPVIALRRPSVPVAAEAFIRGETLQQPSSTVAEVPVVAQVTSTSVPAPVVAPAAAPELSSTTEKIESRGGHLSSVGLTDVPPQLALPARPQLGTGKRSAAIVVRADGRIRRRMTAYIDPELATRLAVFCAREDAEMSDVFESALRQFLPTS